MNEFGRYSYYLFGLHVVSDIPLFDVQSDGKEPPDVVVSAGNPRCGFLGKKMEARVAENPEAFFVIEDSTRVTLDPAARFLPDPLKSFLVRSALFRLLARHGGICVHGSAVACRGRGFVFSGESGCGKSTLAASLNKRGHVCLSDDQVFLFYENGNIRLAGDRSLLKLTPEAAALVNMNSAGRPTRGKKGKFEFDVFPKDAPKTHLSCIYYLEPQSPNSDIGYEMLSQTDGLKLLLKNTRSDKAFFEEKGGHRSFDLIRRVSGRVPSVRIRYPRTPSMIEILAGVMEKDLHEEQGNGRTLPS